MRLPLINNLSSKVKKEEYSKYLELIPDFKKEKTQKFTTIVLTLIASIVLGLFAVNPTLSTIANLRKQIEDDRFVDLKLQEKINNLTVLQQQYVTIQQDLPIIYDAVPQTSEVANLAAQIRAVAKESSLSLTGFQTFELSVSKGSALRKKYSSFEFAITAEGDYQNMLTFIDKLVNFQRVITVDEVAIVRSTQNNQSSLQLSVKATAYLKD